MESLFEFHKRHNNAVNRYSNKTEQIRKKIEALKKEEEELKYPYFSEWLEKFATRLIPHIKGATRIETFGPFGLGNETSVYFYDKSDVVLGSACFRHGADGYELKDYSKNTGKFPSNTLGAAHGLNYETIPMTDKMTVEWFVKFMKKNKNY